MRTIKKPLAVFITEDGNRVQVDLWEKVFCVKRRKEIYAFYAHPDFAVTSDLFFGKGKLASRDERNYDLTTKVGNC